MRSGRSAPCRFEANSSISGPQPLILTVLQLGAEVPGHPDDGQGAEFGPLTLAIEGVSSVSYPLVVNFNHARSSDSGKG